MRLQASLGILLFATVACSNREADACTTAIWRAHETVGSAYWRTERVSVAVEDLPGARGFYREQLWATIALGVEETREALWDALDEIEAAARACGRPEDG